MKKTIPIFLIILFSLFAFCYKVQADDTIDLNLRYPSFGGININENQDLNQIIAWAYYFIIGISGFSAFFMFVWGGLEWVSSSGNPSKIEEAKEKIQSAAIGLLIILSAYLVLQIINPELTTLDLPNITELN